LTSDPIAIDLAGKIQERKAEEVIPEINAIVVDYPVRRGMSEGEEGRK